MLSGPSLGSTVPLMIVIESTLGGTLKKLKTLSKVPWMVCGDLNEVLYSFKKIGGVPGVEKRMEAFHNKLEERNLMDLGCSGN